MTIMWIFRRLIRCLIPRKEGEHRGTWGKDASGGGGVWVWKPLPGAPLAPMPEPTSVSSLPALNLLYDPGAVCFGTAHYQVLLPHWAGSSSGGKAQLWCSGYWGTVVALPQPIYDPGC